MKQSKRTKTILSIALVAVLVIGATWAFMTAITDTATNVFAFEDGITADLEEPEWKGGEDKDDNGIPDAAEDMIPGSSVAKDPQIVNTCKIDEYVAIKLTFQDGKGATLSEADVAKLLSLITISYGDNDGFNEEKWKLCNEAERGASEQTWYYDEILLAGDRTEPIFDLVTVNKDMSTDDFAWLNGKLEVKDKLTGPDGFQIYVEGAAVQADTFENAAEAAPELYNLLNVTELTEEAAETEAIVETEAP